MADLVPQLSAVIADLRRPASEAEAKKKKLRGVFYCLPLIKNKQNLWVLLQELALSPTLFVGDFYENIEIILYAVDGIQFSCGRKHQITSPTLTFSEWVNEIVQIAYTLPPLIGLILMSGLAANNIAVIPGVLRLANAVSKNSELIALSAACLSRAQWSYRFTSEAYHSIERTDEILRVVSSQIIFTQDNVSLSTPAMTSQIGSWSRLVSGLLLTQPVPALLGYLEAAQLFVRTVVAHAYDPEFVKPFFFGIMIQLEGVATQILTNYGLRSRERTHLAVSVLETLQPLGYVTQSVGSRFESYQFVLNVCLDTVSETSLEDSQVITAERSVMAISALGAHWSFGQPVTSAVAAGDLVVFLEVAEQLMPVLSTSKAEQLVLPIALRFLSNSEYIDVFEAAHSLMLSYLATHHSFKFSKANMATQYFDQLMQLFPTRLTASQFRTAVEAVMRAVDDHKAVYVLNELYKAAKQSLPGFALPKPSVPQPELAPSTAPTLRAALLSALLHAASSRCNSVDLNIWLHRISPMVPEPYSPATTEERNFLINDFKTTVASLGAETSDVGLKWFFGDGWSRL